MSSDQSLRIGFVGAGNNTRVKHIPGFQRIAGVQLMGVANRSRESGEKVAAAFGIPKAYDNWRDLVKAPDIDAVCIGTWPYMHCEITLAALEAGKHVLTEARMAMNLAEAKKMLEAASKAPHLVTQIVPAPATLEVDSTVQELLSSGYLGRLESLELNVLQGFADLQAPLHWRQDRRLSGNNILGMGIWVECIQRWLGLPASVMASAATFTLERRGAEGRLEPVTVPDQVDILATWPGGAVGHLRFSGRAGLAPPTQLWLYGSEGTLCFQADDSKLLGGRRGDAVLQEITIAPEKRIGWRVEEEFVNAIRGKEKVRRTPFEEGVRYMEFTEAVQLSIAGGRRIDLPLRS